MPVLLDLSPVFDTDDHYSIDQGPLQQCEHKEAETDRVSCKTQILFTKSLTGKCMCRTELECLNYSRGEETGNTGVDLLEWKERIIS